METAKGPIRNVFEDNRVHRFEVVSLTEEDVWFHSAISTGIADSRYCTFVKKGFAINNDYCGWLNVAYGFPQFGIAWLEHAFE
jgi:hypothetical protein